MLAPIKELADFKSHIIGKPIITNWVGNPYIKGAYAACLPRATRFNPWKEGRLLLCGDSFSPTYPASLAGAYLSGIKAVEMLVGK